jgi:hypothetical protein
MCQALEESVGSNRAEADVSAERAAEGRAKSRFDAGGDDGMIAAPEANPTETVADKELLPDDRPSDSWVMRIVTAASSTRT